MTLKQTLVNLLPRSLNSPSEIPLFQKWARGRRNLVEIGVFEGASAAVFRAVMSAEGVLHLIDPFIPDSMDTSLRGRKWCARLKVGCVRNGTVRWYFDFSHRVAANWAQTVDFLFIDGDHQESACRRDWEDWSQHVAVDGVVLIHDARQGKASSDEFTGWEGPTKVVDGLFRGPQRLPNWEIVDEAGSLVVVQRLK